MSTVPRNTARVLSWFALLGTVVAVTLAAFWTLLGQRFSPENYDAKPIVPDTTEFALFGGALILATCALALSVRRPEVSRKLLRGALPAVVVSLFVLVKTLLAAPVRTYDTLLFSSACGWTALLWMPGRFLADRRITGILRVVIWALVATLAMHQFWRQARYLNELALGYADCGENARLMFNSVTNPHELFLRVNPDKPLCYDHLDFGIVPFLPLWLLWPDLKLTILLQVVSVLGVSVPLYFIGKRVLQDESAALLVVLAWASYPSTSQFVYSGSYGFRWGNMCLLLYFLALALWLHERHGWALACAVWATLIKEEAAIVVGMFGVYLAVFERRRTAGTALAAFAFGYFILATSVLVPLISGQPYAMTRFFHDLGNSKPEIALSPLAHPIVFWGKLIEPTSLYFTAALLVPLLFLPLRKPSVAFVGSLTLVFCCLNPILKNICLHYQAALLPVVFWALVCAVQQRRDANDRLSILAAVVVSCATVSLFLGALPWSKETLAIKRMPGRLDLVRRFRNQIDPHESLFATQRVGAHFVTQRYLYLDTPVPDQIDYALLDMRDSWRGVTGNLQWLQRLRTIQREVEAVPKLHLVAAQDGLLLYSRQGEPLDAQKLVERDDLPATAVRSSLRFDGGVSLAGFSAATLPPVVGDSMDHLRVAAFFTAATHTNIDLAVRCVVHVGANPREMEEYVTEFQPLGQCVWPVERWKTDRYYAEEFLVGVPRGLAGEISSFSFDAVVLSP
jgi:Predicted membrane protein (DUF2079)